jgi:hypothetical protein
MAWPDTARQRHFTSKQMNSPGLQLAHMIPLTRYWPLEVANSSILPVIKTGAGTYRFGMARGNVHRQFRAGESLDAPRPRDYLTSAHLQADDGSQPNC